jgi:cytochrome c oxidase cbb3-type subunit 3
MQEKVIRSTAVTRLALLFVLVLLPGAGIVAQNIGGSPEAAKVKNPVAATALSVKAGEALFQKNCAFCHGAGAKGDGKLAPKGTQPANLTDATWERGTTDGEIHAMILTGTVPTGGKMPGVKGRISDADVWNIINYIRSLGPKTAAR